jgi:uncharacterized protein
MQRLDLLRATGSARPIIGMVHLQPLPGAPAPADIMVMLEAACRDAETLTAGGVDAILIENYGDAPFFPDSVPAETVAAMTRAVLEVRLATDLPLGVNVLRNDAGSALAIAAASGASFIRVNVHSGAMLTDQGWVTGRAHETLRARARFDAPVAILADVLVKHAVAPWGLDIEAAARDCWERGRADALIVSGAATGAATEADRLEAVRAAVPDAPLLIGSGLNEQNAAALLAHADGAIVGSALQEGGRAGGVVELQRVVRLMEVIRSVLR